MRRTSEKKRADTATTTTAATTAPMGTAMSLAQPSEPTPEKWRRPLLAVLMAAGASSRFGGNKLLHPLDGKPIYRHVFDALCHYADAHPQDFRFLLVSAVPEILRAASEAGVKTIINREARRGISLTIRLGLEGFPEQANERAAFFTADQPWLRETSIHAFLDEAATCETGILSCRSQGRLASPVAFSSRYYEELRALREDEGGRRVMLAHPDDLSFFEIDKIEAEDIDRPADLPPWARAPRN